MQPIIEVKGISKRYRIGRRENYYTLRDALMRAITAPARSLRGLLDSVSDIPDDERIWALRDVSFDVAPGEVLGLIGRNGAGKSTMLKILARITEPTEGRVALYGRVASLLEVGTGFHPELTGRENIYLNGALLGMRRTEIARQFDAIVDFSELDQFIDTPVKHYSSGMYVRLAFAVAAHLQPEILLVDEVLAVGDAAFQKKCLGKMGEVARGGRTVLFVSHNMAAIQSLCDSCLLINGGRLAGKGRTEEMIDQYLGAEIPPGTGALSLLDHPGRTRYSTPMMTSVVLSSESGAAISSVAMGGSLSASITFDCGSRKISPGIGMNVVSPHSGTLLGVNNKFNGGLQRIGRVERGTLTCTLDHLPLMPGIYYLSFFLGDGPDDVDVINEAVAFEVTPADVFGTGQIPYAGCGPIFWPATFSFTPAV